MIAITISIPSQISWSLESKPYNDIENNRVTRYPKSMNSNK